LKAIWLIPARDSRCEILAKIFWSVKLLIMKCSRVSYELHWWGNRISWRNWYNLGLVLTIFSFAFFPNPGRYAQTRICLFVVAKQTRTTIETSGHEATLKSHCEIHKVNYCEVFVPNYMMRAYILRYCSSILKIIRVYQGLNLFQPDGSGRKLFIKFRIKSPSISFTVYSSVCFLAFHWFRSNLLCFSQPHLDDVDWLYVCAEDSQINRIQFLVVSAFQTSDQLGTFKSARARCKTYPSIRNVWGNIRNQTIH